MPIPATLVTKTASPRPRGTGRTAFIGRLDAIRADIARGEFLVTIYAKHQDALGITYSAFRKLVQRYAEDAKPHKRTPYGADGSAVAPATVAPPPAPAVVNRPALPFGSQPTQTEIAAHARHEPRPRTFVYDGNPRQDDKARLIGTGSRSPKD
jgi:hypothetical protein